MCIIIYNPEGKELDKNQLKLAYDNNPHGFGVMWHQDDRVYSMRQMANFDQFLRTVSQFNGVSHAIHLRWRTKGELGIDQCHPWEILSKGNDDPIDLCMMHNGTLHKLPSHRTKSDTQIFACVHNFTPQFIENYFLQLGNVKRIEEVFNSDSAKFGGSNKLNDQIAISQDGVSIIAAPLATMIFAVDFCS